MKALITGGARSGKSRRAQALAESLAPERVYLATGQAFDAEMADRIARHQADRGAGWTTIEAPIDVAPHLHQPGKVVLLDCLTLWVSNLLHERKEGPLDADFTALADAVQAAPNPVILVTNEVGLGIVPLNPLARRFRDEAGFLGQRLAELCDRVELVALGQVLTLKETR